MSLLNVGSLGLGLVAWILPILNMVKYRNKNNSNWAMLSFVSLSACAIAIYFQILYNNYLVKIEDWSALMDITGAVKLVAGVLLIGTILLNVVTFIIYKNTEDISN